MPDVDDKCRRIVDSVVLCLNNLVIKQLWGTVNHDPSIQEKVWETVALGFRQNFSLTRDNSLTVSLVVMKQLYTINK